MDQAHRTAFPHDAEVDGCRQYKFAVVFEDYVDSPGLIGPTIVSAFLASSIPIFYGHSSTVSWLFIPEAFMDCRTFESITECAASVARVHASSDLYEAMISEPPIVNRRAFTEVFSWHPDAILHQNAGHNLSGLDEVGQRFWKMVLAV